MIVCEVDILHKKDTDMVVLKEKFTVMVPGVDEAGTIVFKIRFATFF